MVGRGARCATPVPIRDAPPYRLRRQVWPGSILSTCPDTRCAPPRPMFRIALRSVMRRCHGRRIGTVTGCTFRTGELGLVDGPRRRAAATRSIRSGSVEKAAGASSVSRPMRVATAPHPASTPRDRHASIRARASIASCVRGSCSPSASRVSRSLRSNASSAAPDRPGRAPASPSCRHRPRGPGHRACRPRARSRSDGSTPCPAVR